MTTHSTSRLAIHGGTPVRDRPFPEWPAQDGEITDDEECSSTESSERDHGDVVSRFESDFAASQEALYSVCVCDRTLAMAIALRACGVGPGDEVVVSAYSAITTVAAVIFLGAVPVFADIDPETLLLDPDSAEAAFTPRTKAVVPFHVAGRPCDLDAFTRLGRAYHVQVVEDAAHALGAEWHGRRVGAIGDIGTFGLSASCTFVGEAGALTTNDPRLAARANRLVRSGRLHRRRGARRNGSRRGLRASEAQVQAVRRQFARYPGQLELRSLNARRLCRALRRIRGIALPPENPGITVHAHHGFFFRLTDVTSAAQRDLFVQRLAAEGIPCTRGYSGLHRNPALRAEIACLTEHLGRPYPEPDLPATDRAVADTVWLPPQVLLGKEEDTLDVRDAILKVHAVQQAGVA